LVDEVNPQVPTTSTAWQLWYSDTFDRESTPSLQVSGTNIVQGLYRLWLFTLSEGILGNGSASFSRFHLAWGSTPSGRVDIAVNPFDNLALLKLRQWTSLMSQHQNVHDNRRETILSRLAQLHYELLQTSTRWTSAAIDWRAEARELLVHVESIRDPGEI